MARVRETLAAIVLLAGIGVGEETWAADTAVAPSVVVPVGAYTRSDAIVWTTLAFGVLHHADHVIRDNHSGFPFTGHLTPFTPTLLVYPLVLGGIALDAGPLYWTVFGSAALVGVIAVHATLEPLGDIHDPWAQGTNLTGARSSFMGGAALGVLGVLTAGLAASLVSSIVDGRRYGFTWKRRAVGTALTPSPLTFGATPSGQVFVAFDW